MSLEEHFGQLGWGFSPAIFAVSAIPGFLVSLIECFGWAAGQLQSGNFRGLVVLRMCKGGRVDGGFVTGKKLC